MRAEYFSPEPLVIGNALHEMRAVERLTATQNYVTHIYLERYADHSNNGDLREATDRLYERLRDISLENLGSFDRSRHDFWLKLHKTGVGQQADPFNWMFHRDHFPQVLCSSNALLLTRWACGTFYYDDELVDLKDINKFPHINRIVTNALIRGQMHLPTIYPGDVVYDSGATYHIPPYNNTKIEQQRLFARIDLDL